METLRVERKNSGLAFSYDILWKTDFSALADAVQGLENSHPGKICIVTDSNVGPLYLEQVKEALAPLGAELYSFVIPAGEENKNLTVIYDLYTCLIENKFQRNDMLAALGGGVTGDMTGFTAATYLRGIDFIQIPTSLLAQVDSSVGGKTGVDFAQYKNMVGAFYQPRLVYMNMSVLKTLPDDQFSSGMGEVVKTAEIRDAELLTFMEEHTDSILARDPEILSVLIHRCCRVKAAVVEEDPTEKGIRAILNFGHTLGHAIEKCKDFSLLHGTCVGIGIVGAAYASLKRGLLTEDEVERIKKLNKAFGLPCQVEGITADQIIEASKNDKKMESGQIKFILLDGIGNAIVDKTMTAEELYAAAAYLVK
ncbi:MAG: 3-dehydroquinate synthase [Eubacteriales bacterium]|nr:3-dehydroquinate synthase [Eubacteriales bacterium]